ncbi:MAG: hypothetical protein AB8G99_22010 [Planctomycetaceae bacterium]
MNSKSKQFSGLQVGVIGLPDRWQEYQAVMQGFPDRIRISAVFDPRASVAKEAASQLGVPSVGGVLPLVAREDVSCLMIHDAGWLGSKLMPLIAESKKPVFFTSSAIGIEQLQMLDPIVQSSRSIWVPSMEHRFTPATTRMMELIATQLGSPRRIDILLPADAEAWSQQHVADLIDWSFFMMRSAKDVRSVRIEQAGCRVRVDMQDGGTLDLFLRTVRESESPCRTIRCSRGEAMLLSDSEIEWKLTGHKPSCETLSSEQSGLAMQLIVFLRRAAGGLIPTAAIADLQRSQMAAEQILRARF